MTSNFGSLGDFFPTTEVPCRVRGCRNVLHLSGDAVMKTLASGKGFRSDRMCDECFSRLHTLTDREFPCTKPGCKGTWVWNRYQQLEAHAAGRGDHPPHGLCQACREELKKVHDLKQPCRMKHCTNTWNWSAREQLAAGGKPAPRKLCEECFQTLNQLQDQELPCRVRGCEHKVPWNRYQQLEHLKAGRKLESPPTRLCDSCWERSKKLSDKELPCRIQGCKSTWKWRVYEQLEAMAGLAPGVEPKAPSRMCNECFSFYQNAKDIEQSCRNHPCKNTWIWTRSMQLGAKAYGQIRPPGKLCDECNSHLKTLSDLEVTCMVDGCQKTWTYKAEEQLRDKAAGKVAPPHKRCAQCNEFLATHQAKEIACEQCGQIITLSAHEQLDCALAVAVKPNLCADCVGAEIAQLQPPAPEPLATNRLMIRIPKSGAWTEHGPIRDWPPRMTRDKIEQMEQAKLRVVCIGDELTLSCEQEERSWPSVLEANLQKRLGGVEEVCVLNAGIPGCTTFLAERRYARDVEPFTPHLVIFSFAFSDARCGHGNVDIAEEIARRTARLADDFTKFDQLLLDAKTKAICWLPNPIYPHEAPEGKYDSAGQNSWCAKQSAMFEAVLRQTKQSCRDAGLKNVVDAKSLFIVNGEKSARRWMTNDIWYMHNETGAQNIAAWIENAIVENKLLEKAFS